MRLKLLFIFIFSGFVTAFAGGEKKVILLVNKFTQHEDTLGFNIVTNFCKLSFEKLQEGKINLYTSPKMENIIDFQNIISIEKTTNKKIIDAENLFIYETWNKKGKSCSFKIKGFVLSTLDDKGNEVTFGYIDFSEIADYLRIFQLNLNVNGSSDNNLYKAFMNKTYNFDLIFFDDMPTISPVSKNTNKEYQKSVKLKNKYFGPKIKNLNKLELKEQKLITYYISSLDYQIETEEIIESIENYFALHKRELLLFGGSSLFYYFREHKTFLTGCIIEETWTKKGNDFYKETVSIQPFLSNNVFKNKIPEDALDTMSISIGTSLIQDALIYYDLTDYIIKINQNEIISNEREIYLEAIHNSSWNKISAYIRQNIDKNQTFTE
jgi:hypothetical protein